jgi:glycosyltransferase involved in cell wall biosynthesis
MTNRMTDPAPGLDASSLRVLIACEHASARFGGEAALPLHYFRILNERGHAVWLVSHARSRDELTLLFGDHERIHYIKDNPLHRLMWRLGGFLPDRLAHFSVGLVSRWVTQIQQRRLVRELVRDHAIQVVHQPMPVSPKEPSMLFDLGVPVVIGPMNGGMNYPAAFAKQQNPIVSAFLKVGRMSSHWFNAMVPGKRRSAVLLVANERTRQALPAAPQSRVIEMVENGVNLSLWQASGASVEPHPMGPTRYLYMGRLVDWKAVDLLLLAFKQASQRSAMTLTIAGDGSERAWLHQMCKNLGILAQQEGQMGSVFFAGWQTQEQCATLLKNSSALVLPSLLECGGAVVLEAMAASRPVIATHWGGPADYLDESCGILVHPHSREQFISGLSEAMVKLSNSHPLRVQLGRAGNAKAVREYDWQVKVDQMLDIYAQTAQSSLSSSPA